MNAKTCTRADNPGWRYFLFTMGGIMLLLWGVRFLVFRMYESPKFLMGRGRDEDAVAVVHAVAAYNGMQSSLTLEHLQAPGRYAPAGHGEMKTGRAAQVRRALSAFRLEHVRALFATRKMAYSTSLLIAIWGASPS